MDGRTNRYAAWTAGTFSSVLLLCLALLPPSPADEIRFRSPGPVQEGAVLSADDRSITIRFPREAVESIAGNPAEDPSPGPGAAAPDPGRPEDGTGGRDLAETVRMLEERVRALEGGTDPARGGGETGSVEGTIVWSGKPLSHGAVAVVAAERGGMPSSAAAAKGTYRTETDGMGRFRFLRVPPGKYLFYWMPDEETGWVRRLRDRPDFEVLAGEVTIQNIPGNSR